VNVSRCRHIFSATVATLAVIGLAGAVSAAPGLTASPTTVAAGGNLTATWSGIASPTGTDWIGLYAAGAPDSAYLVWIYVNCTVTPGPPAAAGACVLQPPAGLAGGTYELRLFSNDTFVRLATSNPFTVTSSGGPHVFATPTTVAAGGTVIAFWNNIPNPTGTDWIGLYAVGAPDTAFLAWMYVNCATVPTNPVAVGLCNFLIPANVPAGQYELRLFPNDSFISLATSKPLTVTSSGPVISGNPTTLNGLGSITVAWGGIPNPTARDWIGLYKRGTPDTAYLAWIYVSCSTTPGGPASAGACPFPLPPGLPAGLYELRFLPNDGFSRLATSNPLIVN
jgi:hypothetical protein